MQSATPGAVNRNSRSSRLYPSSFGSPMLASFNQHTAPDWLELIEWCIEFKHASAGCCKHTIYAGDIHMWYGVKSIGADMKATRKLCATKSGFQLLGACTNPLADSPCAFVSCKDTFARRCDLLCCGYKLVTVLAQCCIARHLCHDSVTKLLRLLHKILLVQRCFLPNISIKITKPASVTMVQPPFRSVTKPLKLQQR